MTLPQEFEEKMKELLNEEFSEYQDSFEKEHYSGLRINTLKITKEQMKKISPVDIEQIPYIGNGFFFDKEQQPARHPYYHAGLYYLQEPSAMTPASMLPVNPGDKVLDLCAAPGGKSTELAARLQGKGVLVTNDISNSRAKALLKNIELFGVKNAIVMSESPDKMESYFVEYFDKILVDAPCSGEGMFRKVPSMVKNWEEVGVDYYKDIQRNIIISAAKMLKKGGYLLYSTCTFSPEENEGTIAYLLEEYPEFKVVSPYDYIDDETRDFSGFGCGHPEWIDGPEQLKNAIRLWPHKIRGEGHFICLLQKGERENEASQLESVNQENGINSKMDKPNVLKSSSIQEMKIYHEIEASLSCGVKEEKKAKKERFSYKEESYKKDFNSKSKSNKTNDNKKQIDMKEFNEFFDDLLLEFDESRFLLLDEKLYYLPDGLPSLKGLRLLRNGLLLGEFKNNRFEPSHSLALAISKDEYKKVIDLTVDDERVIRYLKGETIDIEDERKNGYYLIAVNGYPLGWGKLTGYTLKNKYNPGWRWM